MKPKVIGTWGLGNGRILTMERVLEGYRVTLIGFHGVGATQDAALDDLLARMREYREVSDDFMRSTSPGGSLHEKLQQIGRLVNTADVPAAEAPDSQPRTFFREVHIGCGGAVVLAHEQWRCQKCRKTPVSVLETKTVYEEKP